MPHTRAVAAAEALLLQLRDVCKVWGREWVEGQHHAAYLVCFLCVCEPRVMCSEGAKCVCMCYLVCVRRCRCARGQRVARANDRRVDAHAEGQYSRGSVAVNTTCVYFVFY